MPYDTRAILVDANGKPIPQYFDPVADAYQPLYGRNGATRVELYDASGNPITVTSGKLAVRATELEDLLDAINTALGQRATENTLSAVSDRVQQVIDRLGEASGSPSANTLADRLKQIADRLGEVSATPAANTLAERLKQIADRLGEVTSNPAANTVLARLKTLEDYLDGLEAALGTTTDAEATGDGSLIALVKRLRSILTDVWNDAANAINAQVVARTEPQVTTLLTTTPLGVGASYTQPAVDAQEFLFPNGAKGALSVSGLARADVQGTLYLEVSNDGTNWFRATSVAVNSTGVARLRRTNLFTRYFRFRFVNNAQTAQSTFSLYQTVWQVADGQGNEHGEGADRFNRSGSLAAGVTETVADIYGPAEIQELLFSTDHTLVHLRLFTYKDDGSPVPAAVGMGANGVGLSTVLDPSHIDTRIISIFEPTARHDPSSSRYSVRLRRSFVAPKGFRVQVINNDTGAAHNAGVYVLCRLL